jgi:hypothetical protein
MLIPISLMVIGFLFWCGGEYLAKITARVSNLENELLQLKRQVHS